MLRLKPGRRAPDTARASLDTRFAAALVLLLSLASLSVAATTSAVSRDHADRMTTELGSQTAPAQ